MTSRYYKVYYLLGNLEDPEQPDAAQHRDTKRRHYLGLSEHHLADGPNHDEAVEAVEKRDEVTLKHVRRQLNREEVGNVEV